MPSTVAVFTFGCWRTSYRVYAGHYTLHASGSVFNLSPAAGNSVICIQLFHIIILCILISAHRHLWRRGCVTIFLSQSDQLKFRCYIFTPGYKTPRS